jgi:hypothetical protein
MKLSIVVLTVLSVFFISSCTVKPVYKPNVTEEYQHPYPFAQQHQALTAQVTQLKVVNQSDVVTIVPSDQYVYWVKTPTRLQHTVNSQPEFEEKTLVVTDISTIPEPQPELVSSIDSKPTNVLKNEPAVTNMPPVKNEPAPNVVIIDGEEIVIGPEEDCF